MRKRQGLSWGPCGGRAARGKPGAGGGGSGAQGAAPGTAMGRLQLRSGMTRRALRECCKCFHNVLNSLTESQQEGSLGVKVAWMFNKRL